MFFFSELVLRGDWSNVLPNILHCPYHGFEDVVEERVFLFGTWLRQFGEALLFAKWHNSQTANIKHAFRKRSSDASSLPE